MPNIDFTLLRTQAEQLYYQGYKLVDIAKQLNVSSSVVRKWKSRDKWDKTPVYARVGKTIDSRLLILINKDHKTERDYNEIEKLSKVLERTARIEKFNQTGNEKDLNSRKKYQRTKKKNFIPDDKREILINTWTDDLFDYQKKWLENKKQRIRNILKSRQIGATWYFAREAIIDAIETGDNQIFLSASKSQSHVFKNYIFQFIKDTCDIELKGDPFVLWNGATIYFLSTNFRTAQSYHGHLYFDEYFWTLNFLELRKVASGMAMHKKWRQTYFSTPSIKTHEAYKFWNGKLLNKDNNLDISHKNLQNGLACTDNQWRQIVTVEDAVSGGCNLFDIDQLRKEYSDKDFDNLLMCEFIDDEGSIFSFQEIKSCMVDSLDQWKDFNPYNKRPFGDEEVWIGYDPSRVNDKSSMVIVAPPKIDGEPYRILEKFSFKGLEFAKQAQKIKQMTKKYNVKHIAIDGSGMGEGVYELVNEFFPKCKKINYSVEIKNKMVLKAKHLFSKRKISFDNSWNDLASALMTIHRTQTNSGRHITYKSHRTNETGHGDLAWALLHAIDNIEINELNEDKRRRKSQVFFV